MGIKGFIRKKKNEGSVLSAWGIGTVLASITPIVTAGALIIVIKTGIWWFPLIIAYFVALGTPVTYWLGRNEERMYRFRVGHEVFLTENPDILYKEIKKARKKGIPREVERVAAYYRALPEEVSEFHPRRERKRRIRAAIKYIGATITVVPGVFLLWHAFPIRENLFSQPIKTADFTSIFLLAGGILTLISAAGLFKNKSFFSVRFAAAIMMLLSVWSSAIAETFKNRQDYTLSVAYAVCLAVFIVAAFAVPAIAGDIRNARQVEHDRKELRINLYELGYINEAELQAYLAPEK